MSRHGKYANPRRKILDTAEEFALQDAAAGDRPWSEWAREVLRKAARKATKKP